MKMTTISVRLRQLFRERVIAGRKTQFTGIWFALVFLFAVSPLIAPSSVQSGQLINLMFFASFVGLAAIGQHLVISAGGLDLSVAGVITLSALVYADAQQSRSLVAAAGLALLAAGVIGLISGLAVTVLRVTPLIATLGAGAIATGAALEYTGSNPTARVSESFSHVVTERVLGTVPVITLGWLALAILVSMALRWTVLGRNFVAVGDNPRAARAIGLPVDRYRLASYLGASLFYCVAGIALAGFSRQPGITTGDQYLLLSIAAVVLGGTPLGGGVGSVLATAGGALFMTHVNHMGLAMRAPVAVQLIMQGVVIVAALGIYNLVRTNSGLSKNDVNVVQFPTGDGPGAVHADSNESR